MSRNDDRRRGDATVQDYLAEQTLEVEANERARRARSVTQAVTRERLFQDQMEARLDKLLSRKYFPGKLYIPKKRGVRTERNLNLMLSDLHFGACLDPREVPVGYGHVEEARRLAAVAVQAADYKRQYRDQTKLVIHLLGDLIQNQLHDPRDGEALTDQYCDALHLLIQFMVFQASQFKEVEVWCTTGNHGRNTARHKEKATNEKWDSLETNLYYSMKKAVAHIPNIKVNIPRSPYYVCETFGQAMMFTHGDTVIRVGFPGRNIDVDRAHKQINEWNANRANKIVLVGVGHVHTNSYVLLPSGVRLLSNGALIPADAYALSIGIPDTACCQVLFESVPGHVCGHRFEADVNQDTDKDKALDKVIQPYPGFDK